jgi:hypothetical protein
MSNTRILLFAKAPVPGRAKTRLIPALGALGAARLQEQLLRATVARLATGLDRSIGTRLELWCAPDTAHPLFQELAATYALELHVQSDGDLGDRLLAGCTHALRRADSAVLIGSDCPDLGPAQLAQAVAALQAPGLDAVLGPAVDGGYVLLGLRRAESALFTDMPWGGDRVAEITRERMAALGWRWRELPALRDVDRPEDLDWFGASNWVTVRDL